MGVHDTCQLQIEALQRERRAAELANLALQEAMAELERAAGTDRLTGAWNRRRLEEAATAEIALARRRKGLVSLLIYDLDHFKRVNDTFGHPAGDAVLAGTAQIVREQLRASDALVRWGGEEFIVLAPATRIEGAISLAEKIRAAVAAREFPGVGKVTVSVGVAEFEPGMDFDAWVAAADRALYRAKAEGRNRVVASERGEGGVTEPPGLIEIVWDDAYDCGEPTIDGQHQRLFTLANALFGATTRHRPVPEVILRLKELLAHVVQHFHDEEALLERVGYPDLPAHSTEHRLLLAKAEQLQREVEAGALDIARLVQFLVTDVVEKHLLAEDTKFFGLFRKP